jgi:hypothetical protein
MDRFRFVERTSGFIRGRILDKNGDPVEEISFTAATLTLWDLDTKKVLNDRDEQDILPVGSPPAMNDVTYEADGFFRWDLQPADNVIVTPRRQIERHRAMFVFAWDTPTAGMVHVEMEIEVENLQKAL